MSQEQSTAIAADVAVLDSLQREAQELAVSRMLDQSRQWLDRALEATNPAREVAEFKAFVATVAEAARQKKLSEGIQLDAVEMVRRSERALGVAIREGQSRGDIANVSGAAAAREAAKRAATTGSRLDPVVSSSEFFKHAQERSDTYDMTDDVTDEQFDLALAVAKDEGNLSRRNVVRKVAEVKSGREQQAAMWVQVEEFAGRGFTSSQIAKTVGMSEQWLRKGARDRGITFPADKITGARRIDPIRVIENTIASIEATVLALDLVTFEDVTPEQADEWLQRLAPGIRAIRQLNNALKEIN